MLAVLLACCVVCAQVAGPGHNRFYMSDQLGDPLRRGFGVGDDTRFFRQRPPAPGAARRTA